MREILWQNGKFTRRDGSTFIPYGGVFAEIIYTDRCSASTGRSCPQPTASSNISPAQMTRCTSFTCANSLITGWVSILAVKKAAPGR